MGRLLNASNLGEEARRNLDLRVADLDLSLRASNVCVIVGAASIGELAQAKEADLERVPNCGRKTITELKDKLSEFGLSLDMRIAGWSPSRKRSSPEGGRPSLPRPRAVVSKHAATLEEELQGLLALVVAGRDLEIVAKYRGLSGQGRRTLRSVGEEYGVSRERIRQIANRVERRLGKYSVETPWLAQAVEVLTESCPATPGDLAEKLRERGIAKSTFDVGALRWVCEIVGRRFPFVERQFGSTTLVLKSKDEERTAEFFRAVRKRTRGQGCVNFEAMCDELDIEEPERSRLKRCVASADCAWLDADERWAMATGLAQNRLINLASKVLAVAPAVSVAELRKAVAKERRLPSAPPTAVMATFLEKAGLATVDGETARLAPGANVSAAIAADSVEAMLIDVLRAHGPVLGWDRFQELSVARGVNPISFGIYASKSPTISRLARGVYALVGAPVPPGVVEEIAAKASATRKPAEWGWLPRGTLWCAIELNISVLAAGSAPIPSFVCEFAEGEWKTQIGGRTTGETIKCANGFVWGFRRLLVNAGAEAGDTIVAEFEASARSATFYIGDEELVDEFEAGRAPSVSALDDDGAG